MIRHIKLRTVAEEVLLQAPDELTLEEFCRAKRLPPSLFQAYTVRGEDAKPIPSNIVISQISPDSEIILRCIRNTDLRDVLPQKTFYSSVHGPITTISDLNLGGEECVQNTFEINPEAAKDIVRDQISDFIGTYSKSKIVVVGISGGGDSNTLVESLMNLPHAEKEFVFFTIILDPIWPASAAARAAELCGRSKVKHIILGVEEIKKLLKMKGSLSNCYTEYCERFGNNTSHFFGTYVISLIARKLCEIHKTDEYILGFNREDLLSDTLYSVMNGQKPLEFPVRRFDTIKLLMPLWKMPKIVLDACYPKYSLSNYKEREKDESTFQRNIIYYLAHGIEDVYANLGLSLMEGVERLFTNNWAELKHDSKAHLYTSEYASKTKIDEMSLFLGKYFT